MHITKTMTTTRLAALLALTAGPAAATSALAAPDDAPVHPGTLGRRAPLASFVELPDLDASASTDGIVPLPTTTEPFVLRVFQKTAIVRTPSGAPIHVLVQRGVPPLDVRQAVSSLEEVLTDVPGSRYGQDKSAVAEHIADVRATLMLFRDERSIPTWRRGSLSGTRLGGMALLADQVVLAGEPGFETGAPDTSLSAAVRLVYEFGIADAMPEYAERIEAAMNAAANRGVFRPNAIPDQDERQKAAIYFATAVEVYYGMWQDVGHATARDLYACTDRTEMARRDPAALDLIAMFFPPERTHDSLVWPALTGTFSLSPEPPRPGAARASMLVNATLSGRLDSGLIGNDRDNRLTGNFGDNTFLGADGDDLITGGMGDDAALYRGPLREYHIELQGDTCFVIDLRPNRDGSDELRGVERLRFADAEVITSPKVRDPLRASSE